MTNDLSRSVNAQLVSQLFVQARAGLALTAVVSLTLGVVLWLGPENVGGVRLATIISWWAATAIVIGFRAAIVWRYFITSEKNKRWRLWLRLFTVGAGLTALCWGIGGAVLLLEAPLMGDAIIMLVIAAMAVSAIPYLATNRITYLVYLALSTIPLIIGLLLNSLTNKLIAAFVVLFCLGIWRAAVSFNELLTSTLTLRERSDRLSTKLQAANSQLADANLRLERDIERRKQILVELQDARKSAEIANIAKSRFLSSMSHELRTPLNAILGFSELLTLMPAHKIQSERENLLANIQASGKHLLSLIDDVLDVARLDSGNIELRPEAVNVIETIDECVSILDPQIKRRNIDVRVKCDLEGINVICIDRLRLRQILLNLISNAVKYNTESGAIDIEVTWASIGDLSIAVKDTGIGISKEDIAKIFQPFVRIVSDTADVQGAGIGLTITKQLIELMGGHIYVSQRAYGGSIFHVTVPVVVPIGPPDCDYIETSESKFDAVQS